MYERYRPIDELQLSKKYASDNTVKTASFFRLVAVDTPL